MQLVCSHTRTVWAQEIERAKDVRRQENKNPKLVIWLADYYLFLRLVVLRLDPFFAEWQSVNRRRSADPQYNQNNKTKFRSIYLQNKPHFAEPHTIRFL